MTKNLSEKNYIKNHLLWIAVLVAVFISACSSANEVTTPDTTTPTLTISTNSSLEQNIPGEIIFYFSEDVNGFTTNDIKLSNLNVDGGNFITNSKKEYTWEITPRGSDELYLNIPTGSFEDLAGNTNANVISTNFTVEEDTTHPLLTNISPSSTLEKNTLGKINFYFNEDVKDFTKDKINLSGVTLDKGDLVPVSKKEYSWEITPKESGDLIINIATGSFQDFAGNANTNSISTNFTVEADTSPPLLTNISPSSALGENVLGKINFYFNEDVKDFTKDKINLSGVDLNKGDFITNSKKEYSWEITPKDKGNLVINIATGSFQDFDGNASTNSISTNFSVKDITPPLLTNVSPRSTLKKDVPGEIVFHFSEDVVGFTTSDIDLSLLSDVVNLFGPVDKGNFITNSKREYTWTITPREGGKLYIEISDGDAFKDLAGNFNAEYFSTNFTVIDTSPPLLTNISPSPTLEQNTLGKISFYFNEDVYLFNQDKIDFPGFDLIEGDLVSVSRKEYYWEITPKESGNLVINIPIASFQDSAGNANTNSISTNFTVEVDKTPPTVSITGVYLAENTAGKIIFTFNEDVTNFTKSDIKFSDSGLTTGEFRTNNQKSYDLIVTPSEGGSLTVSIDGDSLQNLAGLPNQDVSIDFTVETSEPEVDLKGIVTAGRITSRDTLQGMAKDVASYYTNIDSPEVVAHYVKTDGTGDGSSWAKAANDVKATINGITDASDSKIYLVLVASGDYPSDRIAMKNSVAVIGGWNPEVEWERAGVTRFNGQGKNMVFDNSGDNLNLNRTALLYGATITNGTGITSVICLDRNTSCGGGMFNISSSPTLVKVTFSGNKAIGNGASGGGMNNDYSSPTLENVTFSGNKAIGNGTSGGGMANNFSSPTLENVTFSGNKAEGIRATTGGGMANAYSSPTLVKVTFSENKAGNNGGGMYNQNSSPSLAKVTFSGNKASKWGGGMFNIDNSSPTLVKVTFSGNTATTSGGGMYIADIPYDGHLLVNTIFWGNQANESPNQVSIRKATDKLSLHYSIIQGGTNDLGGTLTSSDTTKGNPLLSPLADNGGLVQTHALGNNSPAINAGVYVKKSGDTLYFSQDNTTWYTGFDNNGLKTTATPPNDAEDLTATDARGYTRKGRPDIGAYENEGTAPSAN